MPFQPSVYGIPLGSMQPAQVLYAFEGVILTGKHPFKIYNLSGSKRIMTKIALSVTTAPTTTAIIVDIHKNGTTIFTEQAHRPQIAPTQFLGYTTRIDDPIWDNNQYVEVEIDQKGTGTSGSNLIAYIMYV